MKKFDIMMIKELFLLRYYKLYSKQVMRDFCDYINKQLECVYPSYYNYVPVNSYEEFLKELEHNALSLSPKDYQIRKDFKHYLTKFKQFIYDNKF